MTKSLARELRIAGYETVVALAECQTKAKLKKLAKVEGVGSVEVAESLVSASHTLLGWE